MKKKKYKHNNSNTLKGMATKPYEIKVGDTLIEWSTIFFRGSMGKNLVKKTRRQLEVQTVDDETVIAADQDHSMISLKKADIQNPIYKTEKVNDDSARYRDISYRIVPKGFAVADYEEISQRLGYNAFRNISFDPEKRGDMSRIEWEDDVHYMAMFLYEQADTKEKMEKAISMHNTYKERTKALCEAYLGSLSNCISSAITGPANFPVARAQKANSSADKRLNEYLDYQKNAREKYSKILQQTLTEEEEASGLTYKQKEFLEKLDRDIALAKAIKEKPKGSVPSYIRTNMNSSLLSRLETLWSNRDYDTFNLALDKIKEAGVLFSKTNAIWERHKNTKTEDLYESPELKGLFKYIQFLGKERKDVDEKWFINHNLSILSEQKRYRSLRMAVRALKDQQDKIGRELFPSDYWAWAYLQDEEEAKKPIDIENPKGGVIYEAEGCTIEDNIELERVQIFFPGKPDAEIISHLKHNGFRWSPHYKAWQRQNTPEGRRKALEFAKKFFPKEEKKEDEKKLLLAKAKMKMASAKIKLMDLGLGRIMYEMD